MDAWKNIMDCNDVDELEHRVEAFEVVCSSWYIYIYMLNM